MKKINRLIVAIFPFAVLSGCVGIGSDAQYPRNYTPNSESFSLPGVGEVSTRSIGERMLMQGVRTHGEAIQVNHEANFGGYAIQPGTYPKVGSDESYEYFAMSQEKPGMITSGMMKLQDYSAAVRIDRSGNTCLVGFLSGTKCNVIDYTYTDFDVSDSKDFQQTLIYGGKVGDRVNVTYREFTGGIVRDAFSNRVEYDLSESDVVGYQGARIRVLEADNSSIKYEVLQPFN